MTVRDIARRPRSAHSHTLHNNKETQIHWDQCGNQLMGTQTCARRFTPVMRVMAGLPMTASILPEENIDAVMSALSSVAAASTSMQTRP